MRALWAIFRLILRDQRIPLLRGAVLSVVVLVAGATLLGVSGWFITASAVAGLAGLGAVFDVFRPSAAIRFLALGRTAARYGERVLTHDATLRALETLRLRVLDAVMAAPFADLARLRGSQAVGRLTADIDALDGVALRIVLPLLAALGTQGVAFLVLWWLVSLPVAAFVTLGWLGGAALILWVGTRHAAPLSRRTEAASQALRARLIDLLQSRDTLLAHGRLRAQAYHVAAANYAQQGLRADLDRAERWAGTALAGLGTCVAGGSLALGVWAVQAGTLAPALAALGFFTALALAETVAPLRRAVADLGRMTEAARRVGANVGGSHGRNGALPQPPRARKAAIASDLDVSAVTLLRPNAQSVILQGVSFQVRAGETLVLTGPSGSGKSSILLAIAGLLPVSAGVIRLGGVPVADWDEGALRHAVTYLPQRSALMAGTIRDALQLARPDATDAEMWEVLALMGLDRVLASRGGLDMPLGPAGAGLSGGEARRLSLARALLRRPYLLLLDEPTEGLDDATAQRVLEGLRRYLPNAMIVMASHHAREAATAHRTLRLG